MFPKELYKDDIYRIVHSTEENDACTADGWKAEKAPGVTYKPLSAVGVKATKPEVAQHKTEATEAKKKE